MRALHLTSGNMYGGVETFLTTLAREASAAPDMRSEFALCFEGRLSTELEALGCVTHMLGPVRLSRPHTVIRARRNLSEVLRRHSFDVVVCHQPWPLVAFGTVVRRSGLPLVLWVHMAGDGRHWLERWARLKRPDLAVCNSHFSARRFSEWFSCERVELVYCPVSFPAVRERVQRATLRSAFRTSLQDVVIVQVSRLERLKGQHVLIAALAKLRDLPGWTCWIVGGAQRRSETAYLRQLEALARGEGIADRIRFVGERRDVPAILEAADIFCQPNTSPEAFGLSLVEAMHAGLPVVTSGIGGACEIVDGSCGVLTPPRDASALSNALRGLIVDRGLRAGLSAAARRRPDVICQASRQIRRIEEVLSSIAAA